MESIISDKVVLEEIGHRLCRLRIERGVTQADLAKESGVSKRTVERIEAGESTQSSNLIRVMRSLDILDSLYAAIPNSGPRPMDLLKLHGKERQRVSTKTQKNTVDDKWQWGNEE
ncbi:MAG: helix-turn-helix domain-containing protein [Desulfuromonadales bacterium]|jgi:transcriptional regulator with XRE-family HTH domain|nr:helix-turn-helix domain-containing protein [Desulfuromonadales bacterium]MDH3867746.1 helix-turn-helix domain-containing protein [Desulfuromonadales bacterium]MDH3959645.1 helix-turn-helix domain-containing protein [Desulfuromonadales bacterium]MDH4024410.1 helix-turn-helix domain-containing protein [Desulfuromonadales bacterium]